MPKHLAASDKGDLLIEYGVILPMSLTEQQKQGALGKWGERGIWHSIEYYEFLTTG